MAPLGLIGEIYLVSAVVGIGVVLFTFAMGHMHGGHADGGHGHTDMGGGHHDGGLSDTSADGGAHGDGSGHAGHHADGDTSAHGHQGDVDVTDTQSAHRLAIVPHYSRAPMKLKQLIMPLLSPSTLAIFLTFFGLTGIFVLRAIPALGPISLVPTVIVSGLLTQQMLRLNRWMFTKMHVSTAVSDSDAIGQLAEVLVPIEPGKTGEVIYTIGSRRLNAPARPASHGKSFRRGCKVVIVDVNQHIALVEPFEQEEHVIALSPEIQAEPQKE